MPTQTPRAVVTEFQTEPEPEILDRQLEYLAGSAARSPRARSGAAIQVVAALVNLTGPAQPDTLEMGLPGLDSPALHLQVATRTLRDEDAALTLDQIAAGTTSRCLLCWISLMRGGANRISLNGGKRSLVTNRAGLRATYGAIVTLFAELTGCAVWKSGLEGWNMRESTVVAEWKAAGEPRGSPREWPRGIAQGRTEGEAERAIYSSKGAGTEVR